MKKHSFVLLLLSFAMLWATDAKSDDSLSYYFVDGRIQDVDSIAQLDSISVFRFIIFSDNKGASPKSSESFARMIDWTEGSLFSIGLGDHVKKGWDNDFFDFLKQNTEFKSNFYPNIADGENEYYGESQADWGAGSGLLDFLDFEKRENTVMRENGCEYYSKIHAPNGFTIHLIQVHYPDQPNNDSIAFPPTSRNYLIQTLEKINPTDHDIVIACAHSIKGYWFDEMSDDEQAIINEKCDLVLSATTHFFERFNEADSTTLFLNTGSIPHSVAYCPPGYTEIHVLDNPPGMILQYLNADIPIREFQNDDYAFFKTPGGTVQTTNLREKRETENYDKIIGYIDSSMSRSQTTALAESLYIAKTNADLAVLDSTAGIDGPEISYRQLWRIFPYNNEIWVLNLAPEEYIMIFDQEHTGNGTIRVAVNAYIGNYIVQNLNLSEDKIEKTGIYEIGLLTEWLYSKDK